MLNKVAKRFDWLEVKAVTRTMILLIKAKLRFGCEVNELCEYWYRLFVLSNEAYNKCPYSNDKNFYIEVMAYSIGSIEYTLRKNCFYDKANEFQQRIMQVLSSK